MNPLRHAMKTSLLFLGIVLLHACGGGGGGDPIVPTAQTPPAVTQTIPTSGGTLSAALANGAHVVLTYPAGALAAGVDITVTPSIPAAGDWLSFQLSPGTDVLLKPVTMTVTPPTGLDAKLLPQLRLGNAANPLWLISKTNADGTIAASLPALPMLSLAAAARTVSHSNSAARLAALVTPAPANTTITGANFLLACELSQSVVDDATTVLNRAIESDLILKVINLLANIKTQCGVSVATQGLLEQFAATASQRYTESAAAFTVLDYTSSANFVSFAPGLRRALSWCRVAQLLNAQPIDCPNVANFELSFNQLIVGISTVAAATDELYELRNQYKKVLPLAGEAAAIGADSAMDALLSVSADLADLLIERAYAVCNHGDLYDFLLAIERLGAPSSYTPDMLRSNLALCGTKVVARVLDNMSQPILANERTLLPGGVDDVRPDRSKTTPVPADGSLSMTITGRATSCSRVIGAPLGADEMVVKVGSTELQRYFHTNGDFNGQFNLSKAELLAKLGKPADSKDPIEIEVWREHVVVQGCADENDVAFNITLPNVKLYTVTVGDAAGLLTGHLTQSGREANSNGSLETVWSYSMDVTIDSVRSASDPLRKLGSSVSGTYSMVTTLVRQVGGQPCNSVRTVKGNFSTVFRIDFGATPLLTLDGEGTETLTGGRADRSGFICEDIKDPPEAVGFRVSSLYIRGHSQLLYTDIRSPDGILIGMDFERTGAKTDVDGTTTTFTNTGRLKQ